MRCLAPALLLAGLLAPTPSALAGDDACHDRRYTGDLAVLFVPPRELCVDWDSVRETPLNPADDPELHAAGVRATHSLHYTHARQGGSEVCSLEVWGFATAEAARRGRSGIEKPGWRFDLRGNLRLMSRGVSFSRADGLRPGLLPECHRLADLTEAGGGRPAGRAIRPRPRSGGTPHGDADPHGALRVVDCYGVAPAWVLLEGDAIANRIPISAR